MGNPWDPWDPSGPAPKAFNAHMTTLAEEETHNFSLDEGNISQYTQFTVLHISTNSRVCTCKDAYGRDVVIKAYSVSQLSELEIKQARLSWEPQLWPQLMETYDFRISPQSATPPAIRYLISCPSRLVPTDTPGDPFFEGPELSPPVHRSRFVGVPGFSRSVSGPGMHMAAR